MKLEIQEIEPLRSYQFDMQHAEGECQLLSVEREKLGTLLRGLALSPWKNPAEWSLQNLLPESLIPREIRAEIATLEEVLELSVSDTKLPWEALLFRHLPRSASLMVRSVKKVRRELTQDEPRAAIVVPSSELYPSGEQEAQTCLRHWPFGEPVLQSLIDALTDSEVGLVYLSSFVSAEGRIAADLESLLKNKEQEKRVTCRFCFVHLLHLSPDPNDLLKPSDRVAQQLASLGVESILVNAWNVNPQQFLGALPDFWKGLKGSTLGQASLALKAAFRPDDPFQSAEAFTLYGNPALTWEDLRPTVIPPAHYMTTVANLGKAIYRIEVVAGPEAGRQLPIFPTAFAGGRKLSIGKTGTRKCDIELDDPKAANPAVEFYLKENKLFLNNLAPCPEDVRLNGLPVYQNTPVEGWETITIGQSTMELRTGSGERFEKPSREMKEGRFWLQVYQGTEIDLGQKHQLIGSMTLVGRQGAFPITDPAVSRQHFAILERDGRHFASPLADASLILNGMEVRGESALANDDYLQLSDKTTLRYFDPSREKRS
jgi:hypothetical protein